MLNRFRVGVGSAFLLLVLAMSPPMRSHIKGLWVVLQVLPSPIKPLGLLTPEPRMKTVKLPSTEADVYRPRGFSDPPPLVVIHGANPMGKDDERVRRLALALAAAGRLVIVPQLELRHKRIDEQDPARIYDAIAFAAERGEVGVLAFSYGAGLALVALADAPDVRKQLTFMGTVGTYFDLAHLLQGVTTNTVPYHGRQIPWQTIPLAEQLVPHQVASLLGGPQGEALSHATATNDPEGLDPETRRVYELLTNSDPDAFSALYDRLPSRLIEQIRSLSPSAHTHQLDFPIYALHSTNDPAAPVSESRLLVEATQEHGSRLFVVTLLEHVNPLESPLSNLREAATLMKFAGSVLQEQEGWPHL